MQVRESSPPPQPTDPEVPATSERKRSYSDHMSYQEVERIVSRDIGLNEHSTPEELKAFSDFVESKILAHRLEDHHARLDRLIASGGSPGDIRRQESDIRITETLYTELLKNMPPRILAPTKYNEMRSNVFETYHLRAHSLLEKCYGIEIPDDPVVDFLTDLRTVGTRLAHSHV